MTLPIALTLMALQSSGGTSAIDVPSRPARMPKNLYYATKGASGSDLCDKRKRARLTSAFDARYGKRVRRLAQVILARDGHGWDPGDVVVMPCFTDPENAAREKLNSFEAELRAMEVKYGISG